MKNSGVPVSQSYRFIKQQKLERLMKLREEQDNSQSQNYLDLDQLDHESQEGTRSVGPQKSLRLADFSSRVKPVNDGSKTIDENHSFQSHTALRTLQ